jgi:hypothetical protein
VTLEQKFEGGSHIDPYSSFGAEWTADVGVQGGSSVLRHGNAQWGGVEERLGEKAEEGAWVCAFL